MPTESLSRNCSSRTSYIGAGFGGPHAAAKAAEERAWSGLDAFRHVLKDEVELPKGSFDAILHSILDANVRDQG